ncbi:MAG: hypothetical protein ACYTFN_19360 [Planctomycetota bacterium]|jgi:hypothetical protein
MKRSAIFLVAPLLLVACALVVGAEHQRVSFRLQRGLVGRLAADVHQLQMRVAQIRDPSDADAHTVRQHWSGLRTQVDEVDGHGWITDRIMRERWEVEVKTPLRQLAGQFRGGDQRAGDSAEAMQARIQAEFAKIPLKVTGVVLNQDGDSGALVNGKTYLTGDWISDDLVLHAIDETKIEFRYKGQSFIRPW